MEPKRKTAAELLGVREPPRNTRERLLDTAIDLFYYHGFHAIGLDRILAEVGVTKTTFYKHFESKDDLLVAAIERRHVWESEAWSRAVIARVGDDPQKQLIALFDVFDDWFNAPDYGGCIFINAAAEFPDPRDPVHQAAAKHKTQHHNHVRALATAAKLENPDGFADLYTTLVEGALILRHVHHRNDAARIAQALVKKLIVEHTPARTVRSRKK